MNSSPRKAPDLHVVLVQPEIPWNTGNVGRTCLAAGARLHLVEPLGFSLAARQLKRAGLDYWSRVHPCVWKDWASLERQLPELGPTYLFSAEADKTLWQVEFQCPTVLVFGGEVHGLPSEIRRRHAARMLRIPQQPDSVRSINLSTCVGIAIYEVLRQHKLLDSGSS